MTTLSRLALVLSAAFLALGLTAENDADPKVALKKAELGMESAVKANDGDKFSEFLAPDWKLVGDGGDVMEKDAIIQAMKAGKLKFTSYKVGEMDVRVYGDAAVVIGIDDSEGEWDGDKFTTHERFTDVFAKIDGKWRLVSTHSSKIAEH
jgi:ketosteroid isomerase-like protein